MKKRRQTAVERVARLLAAKFDAGWDEMLHTEREWWQSIAAWHLSALRAARGRTVGYVEMCVGSDGEGLFSAVYSPEAWPTVVRIASQHGGKIARVVLVPPRRKP